MSRLDAFPITRKWPAANPEVIQLYSLPTPNGIKASAMLEESGLEYEPHLVNFGSNDQLSPEFISLNPNNKIPAIIDPNGPDGNPIGLWESGAILVYLAEKSGKLLSNDPVERLHTMQWLMFQMGGVGPMFGQFGFFHKFAGKDMEDKSAANRYRDESIRLLGVVDKHLDGRDWLVGNAYSIADLAIWPWVRTMSGFYEADAIVGMDDFNNVRAWSERSFERPASQMAVNIPSRD
jgi:GST-like protein